MLLVPPTLIPFTQLLLCRPEYALRTHPPDLGATYKGKYNETVRWLAYHAPVRSAAPYLPIGALLKTRNKTVGSAAFALAKIYMNSTRTVALSVGMSGLGKVWVLNTAMRLVIEDRLIAGLTPDENMVNVTLAKGLNWVIIKSVHTFGADFVDVNGNFGPAEGPIHCNSEWGVALGVDMQ